MQDKYQYLRDGHWEAVQGGTKSSFPKSRPTTKSEEAQGFWFIVFIILIIGAYLALGRPDVISFLMGLL